MNKSIFALILIGCAGFVSAASTSGGGEEVSIEAIFQVIRDFYIPKFFFKFGNFKAEMRCKTSNMGDERRIDLDISSTKNNDMILSEKGIYFKSTSFSDTVECIKKYKMIRNNLNYIFPSFTFKRDDDGNYEVTPDSVDFEKFNKLPDNKMSLPQELIAEINVAQGKK